MLDFLYLTSVSITFSQILFISFFISVWFSSLLCFIYSVFLSVAVKVFTHPSIPSHLIFTSELFFLSLYFPVLLYCFKHSCIPAISFSECFNLWYVLSFKASQIFLIAFHSFSFVSTYVVFVYQNNVLFIYHNSI